MIRAMILEPGMLAELAYIDRKEICEIIGGKDMAVPLDGGEVTIHRNAFAVPQDLPLNRSVRDANGNLTDILFGTVVITNGSGDISDGQAIYLLSRFGKPETEEDIFKSGDEKIFSRTLQFGGCNVCPKCPLKDRGADDHLGNS